MGFVISGVLYMNSANTANLV